ncbi:MAG: UvrD-helicase domain-containing protein, partial [Treponema sp.]|nr:UvrD-helicase domain-containing protein [Treponema sp.]
MPKSKTDHDIFDRLNPEQLEAVQSTEGHIRVLAGAGSGKTRALVSR